MTATPSGPGGATVIARAGVAEPRYTIISAVHNVQKYLAEFIDSIEKQTHGLADVEVVAVDDGSTDDSLVLLKEWAARRPELVTVITKENGGQGSARNVGIEHARGTWLTFPDPDDVLRPPYLARVDAFLAEHPDAAMVGTSRLLWQERTGKIEAKHPLHAMFAPGDQFVDISRFPDYFHGSAPAAFLRRDVIEQHGLRFDVRIRPNFEDGHFCAHYLLASGSTLLGFVGTAEYLYRKRADESSTLQTGLLHPGRYTDVPRYGYLDVLRAGAAANGGRPPEWLQNFVLYELAHYFKAEERASGGTAAHGEVAKTFLATLREIAALLDPYVIESFRVVTFDRVWRDILLHGLDGERWVTPYAVTQDLDESHRRVRIAYRFVGTPPTERIVHHGKIIDVEHGKIRAHDYFDHPLMYERIAWVPLRGTLRIELDGVPVQVQPGWAPGQNVTVRPKQVAAWFDEELQTRRPPILTPRQRAELALARSAPMRRKYRSAWVLMDRIHDADDNGERLFRYLHDNRPDINAWFALERGTPDWDRMVREGYGDRMVAHGTLTWRLLMLNCVNMISSHADAPVHRPPAITLYGRPEWKFSFLQHGVIKDDLSRWLNPKHLDLFVTSTPGEQESVAGDYTTYAYTSKEARMTGLPRFDRLWELGRAVPRDEQDLVLVCPTWRYWLQPPLERGSQRREVFDAFFQSEYVRMWTGLLGDARLAAALRERGLKLGFMPHPNIQPALPQLDLPDWVEPIAFAGNDVQATIARCALMVTDYSSMSFNAAYLDRPVVYFQFDADRLAAGGHVGKPGYFRYARDGFGPVTSTVDATVDAVLGIFGAGGAPAPEYQARIDAAFPERDGRCCERTTAAIEDLDAPPPLPSLPRRIVRHVRRTPYYRTLVRDPRMAPIVHNRRIRRLAGLK
jgi:glycosyltransferase involved in cell wall biosynthesis